MKKILLLAAVICCGITSYGQNSETAHPWAGARVAFIGDSITDPNSYNGEVVKYWEFMQEWMSITPLVYGLSGRQWNKAGQVANDLYNDHKDNLDAIFIFLGTNDFNSGVPVGEWFLRTVAFGIIFD